MEIPEEQQTELPQWQKDALDAELEAIETKPAYLQKWEDVKELLLS